MEEAERKLNNEMILQAPVLSKNDQMYCISGIMHSKCCAGTVTHGTCFSEVQCQDFKIIRVGCCSCTNNNNSVVIIPFGNCSSFSKIKVLKCTVGPHSFLYWQWLLDILWSSLLWLGQNLKTDSLKILFGYPKRWFRGRQKKEMFFPSLKTT